MKKQNRKLKCFAVVLLLLFVFSLSACGKKESALVGIWVCSGGKTGNIEKIEFSKNGVGSMSCFRTEEFDGGSSPLVWKVDKDILTFQVHGEEEVVSKYKISGKKLVLSSLDDDLDSKAEFTKK